MTTSISSYTSSHPFSTSTSSRAGQALSPTDPLTQLPNIDFNFDDLRQRMSAFTVKFDAFIERGRKRVLEERNEFHGRMGELAEDHRLKTSSIDTLTSATSTHRALLAREQAEKHEMTASIRDLEATHANHVKARERIKSQMAQTKRQIESKLQAQREYAAKLEEQGRLNGPELGFWECYLGVRLEGAGMEERIKVIFTLEGEKGNGKGEGEGRKMRAGQEEREVWFELDLSRREYDVCGVGGYGVKERVIRGRVEKCVDRLNESRDIGAFLAGMRRVFVEEVEEG